MSFQWIVNNAESISIDRLKTVATTESREGIPRAVSRGTPTKRITVRLPDGLPWAEYVSDIEDAEALDKVTTATITIPYAKFPWYYNNVDPGSDDSFTVLCVNFPQWTIVARNQVGWSGAFVFVETS